MSEYAEQNPRAAEDTPKLTLPESKKTNIFSLKFELLNQKARRNEASDYEFCLRKITSWDFRILFPTVRSWKPEK
jgi:hypothetical protein